MRTRRALLYGLTGAIGLVLGASLARAHGPVRQKVSETVQIAAPPERVWAVIGQFHDMSWDPDVARTEGGGRNEVGAKRQAFLKSGGELDEELTTYDAATFSYGTFMAHNDPKVLPVTNYSSDLKVEPGEAGMSKVTWRAAFYRGDPNGDPPPELNDAAAIAAVKAHFRTGLDALKQKVEAGS